MAGIGSRVASMKEPKQSYSVREYREMLNPSEHLEQVAVIKYCDDMRILVFAVPNGGDRNIVVASKLKAEGVRAGVPDLFFPIPMNGYHGLFLEMKRRKASKVSCEQLDWMEKLSLNGYCVKLARGSDEAIQFINSYMGIKQ